MSVLRWLATIVSYPLGGLLAVQFASVTSGPAWAALAGILAGAVIGLAQWLALRPRVSAWWIAATAAGLSVGAAAGSAVIGGSVASPSLVVFGAIAGSAVGLAQAITLRAGILRSLAWVVTVGGTWAVAWFVTAAVIIDESRGFVVFGLSGAAIVTLVGALVLRLMLGARVRRVQAAAATV